MVINLLVDNWLGALNVSVMVMLIIMMTIVVLVVRSDSVVHWGLVVSGLVMSGRFVRSSLSICVMVGCRVVRLVVVGRDAILHLAAHENFGEGEADRVAILIEVLVLPLGLSVHDLVVDVLAIDDQIVLDVEDEVPWVSKGLGHLTEFVKIRADGRLALFELVGDVVNDVTEVLDGVQHRVERSMLKLVLNAA